MSLKIIYVLMPTYLFKSYNSDVNKAAKEIMVAADTDNAATNELDKVFPESASSST